MKKQEIHGNSHISRSEENEACIDKGLKVIITGSPRSGSSFLASLVYHMGFNLGPDMWIKKPDQHNPRGYFECLPLMMISVRALQKLGGDFHRLPSFNPGWTTVLGDEKQMILNVVETGGIELYKGNRLMVLADLYDELFPHAKWIFIERDLEETYRSRFGEELSLEEWVKITNDRMRVWNFSRPASKALYVNYDDFKSDLRGAVSRVQNFLGVELIEARFEACLSLFKPRKKNSDASQAKSPRPIVLADTVSDVWHAAQSRPDGAKALPSKSTKVLDNEDDQARGKPLCRWGPRGKIRTC